VGGSKILTFFFGKGVGGSKILTFFFGKGVGGWKMYDFFLEPPLCRKLRFWNTHGSNL
jgi:hypothetical protein